MDMKTLIDGAELILREVKRAEAAENPDAWLAQAANDAITLVSQIGEFRTEAELKRKAKKKAAQRPRKPRNGDPGPKSISDLFRF